MDVKIPTFNHFLYRLDILSFKLIRRVVIFLSLGLRMVRNMVHAD